MHYRCIVLVPKKRLSGSPNNNEIIIEASEIFRDFMDFDKDYDYFVVGGGRSEDFVVKELDEDIYNKELKEYEGLHSSRLGRTWYPSDIPKEKRMFCKPFFDIHLINPNSDTISRDMIGEYYLVLIDYHL